MSQDIEHPAGTCKNESLDSGPDSMRDRRAFETQTDPEGSVAKFGRDDPGEASIAAKRGNFDPV